MIDISAIETLLAEKQHHTAELKRIDSVLQQISDLLGVVAIAPKRRGRPPKAIAAAAKPRPASPTPPLKGKRRWFAQTAEQSIVGFIGKGNPTTKEINGHWTAEGRSGKADNALSLLVKAGKLKRHQIKGKVRGSTYSAA